MKTKRFFMTSYLVLVVAYCNVFEGLPSRGNVDVENDPAQLWYHVLWKHKAPFHFVLVQDKFVKEFQYILTGTLPTRVSQEALDFLKGKGICVYKEKSTYIRLYGFEGRPFLLPNFVSDRYFVVEVCRQYRSWSSFFDKKRK
jgi:hypothetical protein